MREQETSANKQAWRRLAIAYAIYVPFWIVALLINVNVLHEWARYQYIGPCLGCLTPILLCGSFVGLLYTARNTKRLIWQKPDTKDFAVEIFATSMVLLALIFVLWIVSVIATYRFLD